MTSVLQRSSAIALIAAALPAGAMAVPDGWGPLLDPADLAGMLDNGEEIRVVHVTGDSGVIPGAVRTTYAAWRGPDDNPGALREVEDFEAEAQRLGITADTPVALLHEGTDPTDMGAAARVYWTLKSMGVEDLALVNGGFEAWKAEGLPTEDSAAEVAASDFEADWTEEHRVTTDEVRELSESGDAKLVDARPSGFFEGLAWTIARPGTIRGADNLSYEDWFDGERMVDSARAVELADAAGHEDGALTVSFCNTGHWAAINWFGMSELAGLDGVRMYAESMAEYGESGGALDNEPGRIQYYWTNTVDWFSGLFG